MKRDGFTLCELFVVLFVAALLFILGGAWLGSQISIYKYYNAIGAFKSAVNLARIRSACDVLGPSGTIFLDKVVAGSSDLLLTVAKNPYDPTSPAEHHLETGRLHYVTLAGLNPRYILDDFPWRINDRLYECEVPNKNTLKCKATNVNESLGQNPIPLSEGAIARLAVVVRLVALNEGKEDQTGTMAMRTGEYARIKDGINTIEYQYNIKNIKIILYEIDVSAEKKQINCETTPCSIVFDNTGFTKNFTAYEICFEHPRTKTRITQKIVSSGAIR